MASGRILLAEDDENMRNGLAELLALEGFACDCACDGEVALAMFRENRPQLIVLDVMMPKIDGLGVCKAIRKQDPAVPILMLSARDTELDRVVGLEHGADDYLIKPFGPRELIARIRSLLRRAQLTRPSHSTAAPVFRLDDLEVDARSLRARRGEAVIDLTAREVALLRLLYERPGEAISRDDLLDECWGRDHLPNSRALDQYISVLRRKVEHDPSRPRFIKTVFGFGYRYDE
ncbi:MAG: response regulator transcription factor [Alphaproteobacteria bacterium]|nr:response regulator transcription factor [Alphaproteobacteria bacterium]